MSKHRTPTGRRSAGRPAQRRVIGRFARIAALVTGTLVAIPVLALSGERDARIAAEDQITAPPAPASTSPVLPATTGPSDGEADVERKSDRRRRQPARESPRVPEQGPGTFVVADAPPTETTDATTYRAEVETGLPFDPADVARFVEATLADVRGWATHHRLARVDGHADLRIVLASPETADSLCAPLDTNGRLSCRNGSHVVINAWRWAFGADSYAGDLVAYRRYVVNHETGHALGYPHVGCPGSGDLAPVMMQQTKGLDGCQPNPWPTRADLLGH